jgi:hypothetical protein
MRDASRNQCGPKPKAAGGREGPKAQYVVVGPPGVTVAAVFFLTPLLVDEEGNRR